MIASIRTNARPIPSDRKSAGLYINSIAEYKRNTIVKRLSICMMLLLSTFSLTSSAGQSKSFQKNICSTAMSKLNTPPSLISKMDDFMRWFLRQRTISFVRLRKGIYEFRECIGEVGIFYPVFAGPFLIWYWRVQKQKRQSQIFETASSF